MSLRVTKFHTPADRPFDPCDLESESPAQLDARLGIPRPVDPLDAARERRRAHLLRERQRAYAAVARAVANGELEPVTVKSCVDCGARAKHYDHRDYSKPLEVVPLCRSCNRLRPHAHSTFKADWPMMDWNEEEMEEHFGPADPHLVLPSQRRAT